MSQAYCGILVCPGHGAQLQPDTVPIPDGALDTYATYTPSGKIFLLFRRDDDPADQEIFHAAVIDDDGSGYHHVFSGPIPQHARANGIRAMMFPDNRRVLLGDYVLECEPDVGSATRSEEHTSELQSRGQ